MSHRGPDRLPGVVPKLSREALQRIFTTKRIDCYMDVLSLKDRVRALAVCRWWKVCLDPRVWPLKPLCLDGGSAEDVRIAGWIASTQPALQFLNMSQFCSAQQLRTLASIPRTMLTELHLSGKSETMRDSLAAVCLFPRLQTLGLDVSWGESGGRLDLAALQSLPALQKLSCNGWQRVELRGGTMLHQLTSLDLCRMEVFTTAAALPSLQKLRVCHGDVVELAGEHFQLPQLSQLELGYVKSADINWPALPQLAQLMVEHWSAPPAAGSALLSTLGRLARLYLRWSAKTWQAAAQLLQAAPPSLRELYLDGNMVGWPKPPLYPWTAELTSLSCTSPAIPPRLGNLAKLQRLDFPRHSAGDLALEDAKWLRGLTSLSQLCFDKQRGGMACAADHIQALRSLLPLGCIMVARL